MDWKVAKQRADGHLRWGHFDTRISREQTLDRLIREGDLEAARRLPPACLWVTCPEDGCHSRPSAEIVRGRPDHAGLRNNLIEHLVTEH